jgi:hypothetical protein
MAIIGSNSAGLAFLAAPLSRCTGKLERHLVGVGLVVATIAKGHFHIHDWEAPQNTHLHCKQNTLFDWLDICAWNCIVPDFVDECVRNWFEQEDERLGKKLLMGAVGLVAVAKHRLVEWGRWSFGFSGSGRIVDNLPLQKMVQFPGSRFFVHLNWNTWLNQ